MRVLRREPVRAWLYGACGPGIALATAYGLVERKQAALWFALAAAVLVPAGAESARGKVTPVVRPRDNDGTPLVPVTGAVTAMRRTGRDAV